MNRIILDVESANTVEQVGGWKNVGKLGIGVCAILREPRDSYTLYGQADICAIRNAIIQADEVCGYNIWGFDLPLIFEMGKKEFWESCFAKQIAPKIYDLFRLVCLGLGRTPDAPPPTGYDCDTLAFETLGERKTEDGREAPGMFQRGEFCRLHSYCLNDVRLESKLVTFAKQYGYLLGANASRVYIARRDGRQFEINSDRLFDPLWQNQEIAALIKGGGVVSIGSGEPMPANNANIPVKII